MKDGLLVVDKPTGLLTVPTPKKELRTLTSILNLYPCHRLDRDTSGAIIYAKNSTVQQKMDEIFRQRRIKKTYTAFIRGIPHKEQGVIQYRIEGLSAQTQYKVIEKRKDFAILEVNPLTGRTNQIRIHLKQIGHPILGETKYAFRRDFAIKAKRLCLHARFLEFAHPVTNNNLKLTAGIPLDLEDFLKQHPD